MNEVKLSGRLQTEPTRVSRGDKTGVIAFLELNAKGDTVRLIALGARERQLSIFSKGDPIAITGRLLSNSSDVGVLIDVAGPWHEAKEDTSRLHQVRHEFESNTSRRARRV